MGSMLITTGCQSGPLQIGEYIFGGCDWMVVVEYIVRVGLCIGQAALSCQLQWSLSSSLITLTLRSESKQAYFLIR